MSHTLTNAQVVTLFSLADAGLLPVTLRMLSELRWLEYLGLVCADETGRYVLTESGQRQLPFLHGDARRAS